MSKGKVIFAISIYVVLMSCMYALSSIIDNLIHKASIRFKLIKLVVMGLLGIVVVCLI